MTEEEMLAVESLVEYVEINDFDTDIKKELFIIKEAINRWKSARVIFHYVSNAEKNYT